MPWADDVSMTNKEKRPKALHPYLPWRVACEVGYGCGSEQSDVVVVHMHSPLASKVAGGESPAAFWGVLASKEAKRINMELRQCTIAVPRLTASIEKMPAKKKRKAMSVQVKFWTFVNSKVLEEGDVLVADADQLEAAGTPPTEQLT